MGMNDEASDKKVPDQVETLREALKHLTDIQARSWAAPVGEGSTTPLGVCNPVSSEAIAPPLGRLSPVRSSPSLAALATALAKAQGQMTSAVKASVNPYFHSKYADFASIRAACLQPLASNELALLQFPTTRALGSPERVSVGDRMGIRQLVEVSVITRLIHSSGEWIENELATVIPHGDPQSVGSAVTYLRRYGLAPLIGLAAEDDDAEATTRVPANPERQDHLPQLPQPAESEQPVTIPNFGAERRYIESVRTISYKRKDRTEGLRYRITLSDGEDYTSFEPRHAAIAQECAAAKKAVLVEWTRNQWGRKIEQLQPDTEKVSQTEDQSQIPF